MLGLDLIKDQKIYLIGSEVQLIGDLQSEKFLQTQSVTKSTVKTDVDGLELVFKDHKLVKKYQWMYGDRDELELQEAEKGMVLSFQVEPHQLFILEKSSKATKSFLGGEVPEEVSIPRFPHKPFFQFLGRLSKETSGLEWLPFDLHLTAPLYGLFDSLFLDYSDPLTPKLVNESEYLNSDWSDELVKHDSELIYQKTFFKASKSNEIPEFGVFFGHLGVPRWIQYPAIPSCPKTGKTMRFVCQLRNELEVGLERTNLEFDPESYSGRQLQKMNFWGDGDIYVFIEPESKIVCIIIQHT